MWQCLWFLPAAEVNRSITGAPIGVNETNENTTAGFEILPNANTGNLTLRVRFSRNATELEQATSNSEFASYAVSAGQSSPDMYIRVEVSGNVNATTLRYVVVRLGYALKYLDTDGDGSADIDESTLTLWRYCPAMRSWQQLRQGSITCGNETITVFGSGVNASANYVWANLSSLSLFGIGGIAVATPPPAPPAASAPAGGGGGIYVPEAVLLANSIDLALAEELVSYLESLGIRLYLVNASNFSEYSSRRYIIILGRHKAYEGVGEIVANLTSHEERQRILAGRAHIVKRSVFRTEQVVHILAGKDRYETANAWRENYIGIAEDIKYGR
ncbi:MAG: hypothetical protein GXN98_01880 [Euryarchaeota archaeon]|nr:hypothetical protein [Euryarchaeota archaeon]